MNEKNKTTSWQGLREEAQILAGREALLAPILQDVILSAPDLAGAVTRLLSRKFDCPEMKEAVFSELLQSFPPDEKTILRDLDTVLKHDPAASDMLMPLLFFKGFLGLQAYRFAHALWHAGRQHLAVFIQGRISQLCGMDIHPAAKIGAGVMMDHATGIVIGATAVVEDDVLFWHGVTLGGRGTENIDRHPKIRKGALIGANATILGNIEIGAGAKIGAGSIVIKPVAAGETVIADTAKKISRG